MKGWLRENYVAVLLGLMLAVVYVGFQASYGLFDVDEAVFTQATRELVNDGPYSMPTYNGVPRYQKPPLIYWVQGAFMQVLGVESLWAARLPSALFALASLALLGFAVLRFTRNRVWALTSVAALGLNLSFVVVGRAATADAALNFFMLALVVWCLEVLYGKPKPWAWLVTGILVALGLLAKGPIAGVPAALVVLPVLLARADRAVLWQRLAPLKVMTVAMVCLLPWLWLLHAEGMLGGFFTQFIVDENLRRFGPGLSNTQGSKPWFYVAVLAVGFMPWVFWLPAAVAEARKEWLMKLRSPKVAVALPYVALVWAVGIVGLFMMSGTKLAHYIVPAYPALAIVVGAWVAGRKPKDMPYVGLWVLVQIVGLVAVVIAVPAVLVGLQQSELHGLAGWLQQAFGFSWPPADMMTWEVLRQPVVVSVVPFGCMALGLVAMLAGYMVPHKLRVAVMAVGAWVFVMTAVVGVVPMVGQYVQAPLASLAEDVAAAPATTRIIHLGLHKPSVLYISQRPFTKLEKPLQLPTDVQAGERVLILTEQSDVFGIGAEMGRLAHVEVLRCAGGYCLVGVDRF